MQVELAIVDQLIDESDWWQGSRITGDNEKQRHKRLKRARSRLCLAGGLYTVRKQFGQPVITDRTRDRSTAIDRPDGGIRASLRYDDVAKVVNLHVPSAKRITIKTLTSRWPTRSAYVADVLSAGLHHRHWSLATARRTDLTAARDFADAIRAIAHENLKEALSSDLYRLYLVMAAYADSDATVRAAFAETRRMIIRQWRPIYEQLLARWRLQLRPGCSIEHLVQLLAVLDEGSVLTVLSSPDDDLLGTGPDTCWLARLAVTVAMDCVEPAEPRTGAR